MYRLMNAPSVSKSFLLLLSLIGLFVIERTTVLADYAENGNVRSNSNKNRSSNIDGGIENEEINRSLIVGGENADIWPYSMAFLSDRIDDLSCGGTLISPTVVLAAGHCEISVVSEAVFMRYGPLDVFDEEIRAQVREEILHPKYNRGTLEYDVMLIVLEDSPNDLLQETPNPYDARWRIPYMKLHKPEDPSLDDIADYFDDRNNAWDDDEEPSEAGPKTTELKLKALGWGHTIFWEHATASDYLQEVELKYVKNEECRKSKEGDLTYSNRIGNEMMCTWESNKDTCHGDSGGPVYLQNPNGQGGEFDFVQVGIISWGEDCADEIFPGVASRVQSSFDWIRARVCSIDGSAAPDYFECTDEHTFSPAPSLSPTVEETTATPTSLEASFRREPGSWVEPEIEVPTSKVAIEIFLDVYAKETAWKLIESNTDTVVKRTQYRDYLYENKVKYVLDLKMGTKYKFIINDEYGDGIQNGGGYRIYLVDDTKPDSIGKIFVEDDGDFKTRRAHSFKVPKPGAVKESDLVAMFDGKSPINPKKDRNRLGQTNHGSYSYQYAYP